MDRIPNSRLPANDRDYPIPASDVVKCQQRTATTPVHFLVIRLFG